MDNRYHALIHELKAKQTIMVEQLHQFCNINSGSHHLTGLAMMSEQLQSAFTPIADQIEIQKSSPFLSMTLQGESIQQTCGDSLLIRKRPHLKKRILLCGHMDTVYSATHPFQNITYVNDNRINGPGVADMKGGLIVILHALTAFETMPEAQQVGWDVFINADEEIGSPSSSLLFEQLIPRYQAGLVYEPSMTPEGTLAKNRKGSGKLTIIATGRTAHAGRSFHEGRNAICYLAEVVSAIDALNNQREGLTLNIGQIAGGEALNVVPDKAVAKVDIRIALPEDEQWVRTQLDKIQKQLQRPDYSLAIEGHFGRPVKRVNPATERLFTRLQRIGHQLGLTIDWKDSGGCCDGNNLAQQGLPVLDTLGVRGGNIHSMKEYILLDSLPERAALSALLMMDLAQGGLEDLKNDAISQCRRI